MIKILELSLVLRVRLRVLRLGLRVLRPRSCLGLLRLLRLVLGRERSSLIRVIRLLRVGAVLHLRLVLMGRKLTLGSLDRLGGCRGPQIRDRLRWKMNHWLSCLLELEQLLYVCWRLRKWSVIQLRLLIILWLRLRLWLSLMLSVNCHH